MARFVPMVGVIGGGVISEKDYSIAYDVGKMLAQRNSILVCGGLGGTMEAAGRGAFENGGMVLGVLPTEDKMSANPYVTIPLPTAMGDSRNVFVVRFSDVLIAFPGSFGTLSEIAFALTLKKCVVYLPGVWNLTKICSTDRALFKEAFDANHAVGLALNTIIEHG